jgi:F0F1-type ATP synthase delta subunit
MAPEQGRMQHHVRQELKLPVLVYGVAEIRRLKRELEALDEFMRQAAIREPGKSIALPRLSRLLEGMAADNDRNLLKADDRVELQQFLTGIEQHAPSVRISFASDPSAAFVTRLVSWLRGNIDPNVLLQVGLQPSIAAGCVVRTPSKVFDLSLRQNLTNQRAKLIEALDAMAASKPTTPVVPPEAPVAS